MGVALPDELLDEDVQIALLQRADRRRRRDEQIAFARIAREVDPTEQATLGSTRRTLQRRHDHVLELESLRPVNGHHLHRVLATAGGAVEVLEERREVLRTLPLENRGARSESGEEGTRIRELLGFVR